MRAQPERRAQYNLVKYRSRRIHDQIATLGRANNPPQIPRVHFGNGNRAFAAQKSARPVWVAVAAPDRMALFVEKLREQGTRRPRAKHEYPHGVARTLSQSSATTVEEES